MIYHRILLGVSWGHWPAGFWAGFSEKKDSPKLTRLCGQVMLDGKTVHEETRRSVSALLNDFII
jgi:hypothetical protein